MNIAYYPGCSLKQSSSLYDLQTRLVCSKLDINLKEIDDWNCCGATSAGKIDDFIAVAMPARNIGIAEAAGFSEIVIPCSACYSRTLAAQKKIGDDPALKEKLNAGLSAKINRSLKISSILEVLLAGAASGGLSDKITKKYERLNPVCYYGCMMTRFPYDIAPPDDVENPQGMEKLLKMVGMHSVDWNYKTFCCGASAAMNDRDTSLNLMAKIMKDAVARGGNCFAVTCPMCQMNLDACQNELRVKHGIKERLPVFFITELIGLAMGMTIEELKIDKHFIDGTAFVKEHETVMKEQEATHE